MLTIFTICKPFTGHSHTIQVNALKSWTLLQPRPQIIVFGNESGTARVAHQLGLQHVPQLACNQYGTPLLSDAFSQAHHLAENDILVYANADIMFFNDLVATIAQARAASFDQFLIIGQRINFDVVGLIDFEDEAWEPRLRSQIATSGQLSAVVCKDYFVFTKPLFADIPQFAVGRGNWDNWMVAAAHRQKIPVIDATPVLAAVHQNHNYAHLPGGSITSVLGTEARQNATVGGGMNLIYGSASSWQFTAAGLKRQRLSPLMFFLFDLPRFMRLLWRHLLPDSFSPSDY